MSLLARLMTTLVALAHAGFLILEMVFWNHPIGQRVFGTTAQFAAESATLAANQGLYNGFLAAGLLWAVLARRRDVATFFLACVVVAGVFGAVTVKPSILYVQALPAALALAALWWTRPAAGR